MHVHIWDKVKYLLRVKGMTQKTLAANLGIVHSALWRKLSGERKVSLDFLHKLAQVLGTSVAYLTDETDDPKPYYSKSDREEIPPLKPIQMTVPILDQEACAGEGFNFDDIRASAVGWLPWPLSEMGGVTEPKMPYFIKVQGDSMMGVGIDDGDFVLVNPNVEVLNGNAAYVKWNGRCSIKGFIHYPDGRAELRPANAHYQSIWIDDIENEDFEILGKVVRWTVSGIPKDVI